MYVQSIYVDVSNFGILKMLAICLYKTLPFKGVHILSLVATIWI